MRNKMPKVQCPNIEKGENVHRHSCGCCEGKQHVTFAKALRYHLSWSLVLSDNGKRDATDDEMFDRMEHIIQHYKHKYGYKGTISFDLIRRKEPIATLNASIATLEFNN